MKEQCPKCGGIKHPTRDCPYGTVRGDGFLTARIAAREVIQAGDSLLMFYDSPHGKAERMKRMQAALMSLRAALPEVCF